MGKLYQFLTQRKISRPPLANYVNSHDFMASTNSEQMGTTSFLLKDKGLEKLDEKKQEEKTEKEDKEKKQEGSIISEQKAQLTNASSRRTNFLRISSRPIQQNIETLNQKIEVKNINVKQYSGSILKLRQNKMLNTEIPDQQPQQPLQ